MAEAGDKKKWKEAKKPGVMKRLFSFSKTKPPRMSTTSFSASGHIAEEVQAVPTLDIGFATDMGSGHATNEDQSNVLPDLLSVLDEQLTGEIEYMGTSDRRVAFFSVFDGHGGDMCSIFAREHLHKLLAEMLWKGNFDDMVGSALHHSFKQTETQFWEVAKAQRNTSGSCSTCVVIKGDKVYCGNAGDSKAMIIVPSKSNPAKCARMVELNERHSTDLKSERQRIKAAGGQIAPDGSVYGVLFPSRGFGDIDVKADGKPVVIAIPNGTGVDPAEPFYLDQKATSYLVVASDGLWDFATDDNIASIVLRQPARHEDQIAEALVREARSGGSEDDITVVVVKITFENPQ